MRVVTTGNRLMKAPDATLSSVQRSVPVDWQRVNEALPVQTDYGDEAAVTGYERPHVCEHSGQVLCAMSR